MDIRTPDPERIPVIDYLFVFGETSLEIRVGPDDTVRDDPDMIIIETVRPAEIHQIARDKVLYARSTPRMITVDAPAPAVPPRSPARPAAIDNLQVLPAAHTGPRE